MRVRVIGVLGSLVSLLLAVPSPNAAAAIPGERHQCGDVIMSSFKLLNNLDNCSGHGLLISGSGIVANLGGHRISGDGVGFEFGVHGGSGANVRILNGVVSNFGAGVGFFGTGGGVSDIVAVNAAQVGIYVSNAKDASIRHNIVTNSFQGIQALLGDADHPVKIESNVVDGNLAGINLNSATGVVVKSNEVVGNNEIGIGLGPGSVKNVISKNKVIGNGTAGGFIGSGSDENIVTGNTFQGNAASGISIFDSDKNKVTKNKVIANGDNGATIGGTSTQNTISGNTVVGNVSDGIEASSAGNPIQKNKVNENGLNGIVLVGADSAVLSNTTNGNGFLNGVDAGTGYGADVTASSNASGNKASFNSNDAQCAPTNACKVGPPTPPALLPCGVPVPGNLTLRHPMDCPDDAVNVTGAGEIDLGPHWISGGTDDGDLGLSIPLGVTDVEITGGVIGATDIGIEVKGSANTLEGLVVVGNDNRAVQFRGTGSNELSKSIIARSIGAADLVEVTEPQTTVESNLIVGGGLNGIALVSGAAQTTIAENRVFGLDVNGIVLDNRDSLVFPNNNVVIKNQMIGNGTGVMLHNAAQNEFKNNVAEANTVGFTLTGDSSVVGEPNGSAGNTFVGNGVTGNNGDGIILVLESNNNLLSKNIFSANTENGVIVVGGSEDNTVVDNEASENALNGMLFDAPDNVADLSGNEANTNGFLNDKSAAGDDAGLGFDGPPTTPGSGNDAEGNDDPLEGQPASLLA